MLLPPDRAHSACGEASNSGGYTSEKVLVAGRSTGAFGHEYLVGELRMLLRARDITVVQQRARYVKASLVIQEQKHALKSGHHMSQKLARLFGWADMHSQEDVPLVVSPASADVARDHEDVVPAMNQGIEIVENGENESQHESKRCVSTRASVEHDVDATGARADWGNSGDATPRGSSRCGASLMTVAQSAAIAKAACHSCLSLQRKLEVATSDRYMAEAELVSLRRAMEVRDAPLVSTIKVDSIRKDCSSPNCTKTGETDCGTNKDLHVRQSIVNPLAAGDRPELDLHRGVTHLQQTLDLRWSLLNAANADRESRNGPRDDAIAASRTCDGALGLAASMSACIEERAHQFEEESRRRLLRLGVEEDIIAARAKLEALALLCPPERRERWKADEASNEPDDRTDCKIPSSTSKHPELKSGPVKREEEESGGSPAIGMEHDEGSPRVQAAQARAAPDALRGKRPASRTPNMQHASTLNETVDSRESRTRDQTSPRAAQRSDKPKRAAVSRTRTPKRELQQAPAPQRISSRNIERAKAQVADRDAAHLKADCYGTGRSEEAGNKTEYDLKSPRSRSLGASNTNRVTHAAVNAEGRPGSEKEERGTFDSLDIDASRPDEAIAPERIIAESFEAASSLYSTGGVGDEAGKGEVSYEEAQEIPTIDLAGMHLGKELCIEKATSPEHVGKGIEWARESSAERGRSESGSTSNAVKRSRSPRRSPRTSAGHQLPLRARGSACEEEMTFEAKDATSAYEVQAATVSGETIVTPESAGIAASLPVERHAAREAVQATPQDVPGGGEQEASASGRQTKAAEGTKRSRGAPISTPSFSGRKGLSRARPTPVRQKSSSMHVDRRDVTKDQPTRLRATTSAQIDQTTRSPNEERLSHQVNSAMTEEADGTRRAGESRCLLERPGQKETSGATRLAHRAAASNPVETCDGAGCDIEAGQSLDGLAPAASAPSTFEDPETASAVLQDDHMRSGMETTRPSTTEHDKDVAEKSKDGCVPAGGGATDDAEGEELGGTANSLEALDVRVEGLRMEAAELEDTIAQLNVAAAQLYLVEYEQMKEKCRQLQRVVMGPASRPTEEASGYGHSCQEVMYRLKRLGATFFRRRIGGAMGDNFFPDGLSRVLSLIGREKVAQGCQTLTPELDCSKRKGDTQDVAVQVAGGIDAEDEPLMEHQVYTLLGKLELALKDTENTLSAYRRGAEEGAREARALLAAAAAHPPSGQTWALPNAPNIQELVGEREGSAGAPRPALNPTNLLFTAAAVLDGVRGQQPGLTSQALGSSTRIASGVREGNTHSRQSCSPAEEALIKLAHDIVTAVEWEQRRSDCVAWRRQHASEEGQPDGTMSLRRPSAGVPPLIWGMLIHLVGKMSTAFRAATEARAFEREVADANLVAAVTLGCSSPAGEETFPSEPCYMGHTAPSCPGNGERYRGHERGYPERNRSDWRMNEYATVMSRDLPHRALFEKGQKCGSIEPGASPRVFPYPSPRSQNSMRTASPVRARNLAGRKDVAGVSQVHATLPRGNGVQPNAAIHDDRIIAGGRRKHQSTQAHDAVALIEAAAVNSVRPSPLHPRPRSAVPEEERHKLARGYHEGGASFLYLGGNTTGHQAARDRSRPQSARLSSSGDVAQTRGEQRGASTFSAPVHFERDTRAGSSSKGGANSARIPVRPTGHTRPVSAGARVVDTRTWSSSAVQPRAFRCRPRSPQRAVRSGTTEVSSPPTHAGEVPAFLKRKERELADAAERNRRIAVNGRFEVVPDYDEGDRPSSSRMQGAAETAWEGEGSQLCPSGKFGDSMEGEGLLPDAGEQAFFDAWKPTDYGVDLSRYD